MAGLTGSATHEVAANHTTGHVGRSVLATPSMIALIEWACSAVTADLVDPGETTVGTHVCVSHESSVVLGERIDIAVELRSVEGRKLTFGVEVTGPRGRVSEGTHQRAVIRLPTGT
ncbi:MAG: putative thioesterase [Actinomycetia bacterium]|nr:putative thioesterase [Actinomycetes bacterium]